MKRRGWTQRTNGVIESYELTVAGMTMRIWRALRAEKWTGRFPPYALRQAQSPERLAAVLEDQARRLLERELRKLGADAPPVGGGQ